GNHKGIAGAVDSLPRLAGASPLYDAIVLSYAEDLNSRRGERNALIVISDGLDNRVYGVGVPSVVDYRDLLEAAEQMDTLIYPIFLGPPEEELISKSYPEKALRRFRALAATTGGRVFTASSIQSLDSVYEDVAAELRSLYSLAYYPSNQDFDGGQRNVQVRVRRPGATVRARANYIAR
ncbi:MAG: VWA domain-containing protein, partial [Pirellulales bacterium]|nr:VWA domain-containing protein [Pirellulales bacterium]